MENGRAEAWLTEPPDEVLVRRAGPLEMLDFQYCLESPRGRHPFRAAQVICGSLDAHLDVCPPDLAAALRRLRSAVAGDPAREDLA